MLGQPSNLFRKTLGFTNQVTLRSSSDSIHILNLGGINFLEAAITNDPFLFRFHQSSRFFVLDKLAISIACRRIQLFERFVELSIPIGEKCHRIYWHWKLNGIHNFYHELVTRLLSSFAHFIGKDEVRFSLHT